MRKIIILILVLGFAIIVLGIYIPKDISSEEEVLFDIKKGEGSREIALNLEKKGLIKGYIKNVENEMVSS